MDTTTVSISSSALVHIPAAPRHEPCVCVHPKPTTTIYQSLTSTTFAIDLTIGTLRSPLKTHN